MGELRYPTELSLDGPWLVDTVSLQELDKLVDAEWSRLEARRQELIEEDVRESVRRLEEEAARNGWSPEEPDALRERAGRKVPWVLERSEKEIRIGFSDGGTFVTESFRAALREQSIIGKVPVGFDLTLGSAYVRCAVSLSRSGRLRANVTPEESRDARELFVALRQWAMRGRAPLWQRLWWKLRGVQWYMLLFLVYILVAVFLVGSASTTWVRARAVEMLDRGIAQTDVPEALELLLAREVHYAPGGPSQSMPPWMVATALAGLVAAVVVSFVPRTVLGIGRGQAVIRRWRGWLRIVGVTLPTLVFTSFVLPALVSLVSRLWR